MQGRDFFRLVWPAAGHYCIAVPNINQQGVKGYKHAVHDSMDDAYLDGRSRFKDTDIYFGVFTHIHDRVLNPKWGKLLPSRKRENMAQAKCLFLDLDVGKGKGSYDTQDAALVALARFVFRTGLPSPIVVSSGNGLHVYWPLTDPVDAADWKPHAANLRAMLDTNHVMYDPSRTTDTTSVLRMPTTINHKDPADLKPVTVLFEGVETDNAKLFGMLAQHGGGMQPVARAAPMVNAQGNIVLGTNFPATDPDEVADACAQVRELRTNLGKVPEPLWYPVVGLLSYCVGGREKAHEWSKGHPNYSFAETEAKMDQWQTNGYSVPSCAKLNNDGVQGLCQKCPHWGGQFKNPVVIANRTPVMTAFVASTPVVPISTCPPPICDPPKPYSRTRGLSVTRWDDVKSLTVSVLHEMDLYPISVSSGVVAGQKVNNGLSTWVGRENDIHKATSWRTFEVPNDLLSDTRELAKHLSGHGWFAPVTNDVAKYMSAYLRELKAHVGLRQQCTHIGWPDKDKIDKFILNGRAVTVTGVEPCVMARTTEIATDGMTQGGTLSNQVAALDFYNRPGYEAQQFMILASLSSPLFMATDQHGIVINASGDSGAGKTTVLKAAAAIWANPAKFIVNGTENGITPLARDARAAALLNLPTMVDEITHMDPDLARSMVMSATQARLRDSLKSDRTPREPKLPGMRSAPMLTSGNASLHQTINSGNNQAGTPNSARVLELPINTSSQQHTKTEADVAIRDLLSNYGWLGEHFLTLAMPCMGMLFESVEKMMKRIDRDVAARAVDRFAVAAAAPVFVAGAFAVYHGLIGFDMAALYQWYTGTLFPLARSQIKEQGKTVASDNVLREFIASHVLDTVVVDTTANIAAPLHLRRQIAINYRKGQGEMWVSKQVFTDWCRTKGTTVTTVLDDLRRLGVVTYVSARKNLSDGTNYPPTFNRCFVVDANHKLI